MGAAFEVYNELGGGLSEEIYQESLEMELRRGSLRGRLGLSVLLSQKAGDKPEIVTDNRPAHGQRAADEAFHP